MFNLTLARAQKYVPLGLNGVVRSEFKKIYIGLYNHLRFYFSKNKQFHVLIDIIFYYVYYNQLLLNGLVLIIISISKGLILLYPKLLLFQSLRILFLKTKNGQLHVLIDILFFNMSIFNQLLLVLLEVDKINFVFVIC